MYYPMLSDSIYIELAMTYMYSKGAHGRQRMKVVSNGNDNPSLGATSAYCNHNSIRYCTIETSQVNYNHNQYLGSIITNMKLTQFLQLPLILITSVVYAFEDASTRSVTIQAWPLSAAQARPLAQVSYDPVTKQSTVNNFNPPNGAISSDDLIRIGIYDNSDSKWRGVVTSATSFDPKYQQKLLLHLDEDGNVWHLAFSTMIKPAAAKGKMVNGKRQAPETVPQIVVELLSPMLAPSPVLNKPVILTAEGKVEGQEVQKTFLQK
jgi:hypothetical protein